MTVHCIELMASSDVNVENVRNKIANLKSDYGEKIPKENAPFEETWYEDFDSATFRGIFRVTLDDANKTTEKNDLTEQIWKEMDKSASWWQVKWHECTHDGDGSECNDWDYKNDSGNVPSEVKY